MKSLLLESDNNANIFTLIKDYLFNDKKDKKDPTPYLKGSISNYSKSLVMTFPTMCDNSLPASTASMISKANERNIVTMLQLLFSSAQLNGSNGADILSKIHKNITTNMPIDDFIDVMDDISDKSLGKAADLGRIGESNLIRIQNEMVSQLKKPQKSFPVNSLSERSLNDYLVYNMNGRMVVKEEIYYSDNGLSSMTDDELNKAKSQLQIKQLQNNINSDKLANDKLQSQINQTNANMKKQALDISVDSLTKQLLDTDVKKANEMVPTLMIVRYNELDSDGTIFDQKAFVAGVKSRLISVDSSDIVERLIAKNKTKVNFLNLIRATTGEIRLFKDFIFCLDQAKINAKNAIKKGPSAQMWNSLEFRSIKNNLNKLKRKGNDASAITTLVINQETVNILKKEYDFDLELIKNARMIFDAYNLLAIVIADESIDVAKFLYVGNDMWEQQSYSYLEKESNDNSYKKVINLLNKTSGR